MSPLTLFWFLLGDATAIEAVAVDPWAPRVGLALAATTGLARHYDSKDLLRQPRFLALPAVTAVALATLLFGLLCLVLLMKGRTLPPDSAGYQSFLGMFLCTAPLAWLYALPYQRFLSLGATVRAKLATLGLVAAWRVAILARALTVVLHDPTAGSLCFVLMVADAVALVALVVTSNPSDARSTPRVVSVMGGIGPYVTNKKQDDFAHRTAVTVGCLGVVLLPLCVMGVSAAPLPTAHWRALLAGAAPTAPPAPAVWWLAGLAALVFLGLGCWTQPSQWRRGRFEAWLRSGRITEALTDLSVRGLTAFPPHWQPPPTADFREPPGLPAVVRAALEPAVAPWVCAIYLERFERYLSQPLWFWPYDDELGQVIAVLRQLPDGQALAARVLDAGAQVEDFLKKNEEMVRKLEGQGDRPGISLVQPEPKITEQRPALLAALADLAGRGDHQRETA